MPIEIREVVIKGTVTDGSGAAPANGSLGNGTPASEDLIKACVEKVLEILKQKNER